MTLTNRRYRLLTTVEALCGEQELGCVSPEMVEDALKWGGVDKTREMMKVLLEVGWLERPYRACYRTTDEGKKVLKEAKASTKVTETKAEP